MKTKTPHAPVLTRHGAIKTRWADQARNDPEYGGAKFDANLKKAKNLITRFGGQKLRNTLNETGMGDNPELLRFVWKLAVEMERLAGAAKPRKEPVDLGKLFYPNFPNP